MKTLKCVRRIKWARVMHMRNNYHICDAMHTSVNIGYCTSFRWHLSSQLQDIYGNTRYSIVQRCEQSRDPSWLSAYLLFDSFPYLSSAGWLFGQRANGIIGLWQHQLLRGKIDCIYSWTACASLTLDKYTVHEIIHSIQTSLYYMVQSSRSQKPGLYFFTGERMERHFTV